MIIHIDKDIDDNTKHNDIQVNHGLDKQYVIYERLQPEVEDR